MPGTRKAYVIKAFLFHPDNAETHWQEWNFDVDGLNTLPDVLYHHVSSFLSGPLASSVLLTWRKNRLPMLRNSLSYHDGEHGVTSFPVITAEGQQYTLRVFAARKQPAPHFTITATLHYHDDPAATLEEWKLGKGADLHAMLGWLKGMVGLNIGAMPDWSIRYLVSKLRRALRNGQSQIQVVCLSRGTAYIVKISMERHAGVE
jgi:hypothetical protein